MDRAKLLLFALTALKEGHSIETIKEAVKRAQKNMGGIVNQSADIFQNFEGTLSNILSQSGPITQYFGNYNPNLYKGINKSLRNTGVDIGVPQGTKIAVPEGEWEVEETGTGYNKGYGNSVLVKNKTTGEKLRFSHLSKVGVKKGQTLTGGKIVGLTGATGNVTGPHLDLEYYDKLGKVSDFLRSQYAQGI